MQEEKRRFFSAFPEGQNGKGLSRNDLCALRFLLLHRLIAIPEGSKAKEESMSIK
jgi:hypothetical protein